MQGLSSAAVERNGEIMTTARKIAFAIGQVAALPLLVGPALPVSAAEVEEPGASVTITEVLVTARKRQENLQDVPDAVTVLSSETIENARLTSPSDLSVLVPNFNFSPTFSPNRTLITMRGISQAEAAEAPVAVVVDGVQLSHPAFLNQELMDVQQIEVLRGPQGSLYGRNAIGGAILLTTRQPTNIFEGRVKSSFGSGRDRRLSASFSGPIVEDRALARVSGSYRKFNGQLTNAFDGEQLDRTEDFALRSTLVLRPSDALTIDLRAGFLHSRGGAVNGEVVPNALFEQYTPSFLNENGGMNNRRQIQDYSAKIDYDFGPVTLTSITAYGRTDASLVGDADFTAAPILLQRSAVGVAAFTHEDRIMSNGSGALRWLLGVYYQDRKTENYLQIPFDDGHGQPNGTFAIQSFDDGTSESLAFFGNASYDVTDALELTIGLRSDRDRRTSQDIAFPGSGARGTFSAVQPKVQLRYRLTPDVSLYTSAGRGFRSGGFNGYLSVGGVDRKYPKEISDSYEMGFKAAFFSNLLHLNVAAFRSDFEGQQIFFITTNPPSQNITSVEQTSIDGVEVELTAQPLPDLQISASYGLADTVIDDFDGTGLFRNNKSPQVPAYTANLGLQYRFDLAADMAVQTYANVARKGEIYWDLANTVRTAPKTIVNLRIALERGQWSLAGYGDNVTDERYPTIAMINSFGPGLSYRSPNGRRQYGVEALFRF